MVFPAVVVNPPQDRVYLVEKLWQLIHQRHTRVHAVEAVRQCCVPLLRDLIDCAAIRGRDVRGKREEVLGSANRPLLGGDDKQLELTQERVEVLLLAVPQTEREVAEDRVSLSHWRSPSHHRSDRVQAQPVAIIVVDLHIKDRIGRRRRR